MITFGSLFAGIGGIDLGLERAGMVCKWQVEIDDYASKVLAKHWPNVARFRDVRECGSGNLPYVDLVAGGFPCQDISYAGRGAGLDGKRSGLWYEFARIIGEIRPRYVLVENVPALLARGIGNVLGSLASFGYDAEWDCIPAAAIGAPHRRDRIFIVAHTQSIQFQEQPYAGIDGIGYTSARIISRQSALLALGTCLGNNAQTGIWSTEPAVGRVADGVSYRMDRLKGLGNAVVPQIAEFLGICIQDFDRRNYAAASELPS